MTDATTAQCAFLRDGDCGAVISERPLGQLRYSLAGNLQQRWSIETFNNGKLCDIQSEWRNVPTETKDD